MAGDHIRREAHPFEHPPGEEVAKVHAPLRVPDCRSESIARLPSDFGERLPTPGAGGCIEPLGALPHQGCIGHQAAEHIGVLGPLPRKERRDEPSGSSAERIRCREFQGRGRGRRAPHRLPQRQRPAVVHHQVAHQRVVDTRHAAGPIAVLIEGRDGERCRCRRRDTGLLRPHRHRPGHHTAVENPREFDNRGCPSRSTEVADNSFDRSRHRSPTILGGDGR